MRPQLYLCARKRKMWDDPTAMEMVIETRRKLENATTRRAEVERELYAAREAEQYILAERKKGEIHGLWSKINQLEEELKDLSKADEDRRKELLDLREKARALRTDMMQADGVLDFTLAAEKKVEAETVQADFEELKAALHEMRRDPQTGTACGFDEEEAVVPSNSRIASATVRVSRFDPFSITVGKNELLVTLIDTPGYGDNTNTVESFEVITDYVESCFQKQLLAETSTSERDYNQLLKGDPLVHCCLYFIAPHRLKYIDLAFMRRLHKWVNIVPIIAKSDTMTTKEKDEFKEHVRKTLEDEEIELYAFDQDIIQKMEQQDNQVYKPPWAVIGSTEAIRDAGFNVYLRKYPWGNALSSEPSHSDLPALRNLIMWSGQWQEMRDKSRKKYEQWRVSQSVASRLVRSAARSIDRQVSKVKQASGARLPWVILLLVLVPLALAAQMWVASTSSSASQTAKLTPRLDQMAADNDAFMALQAAADFSAAVQAYEKHIAVLSHQMNGAQDAGETSAKTAQEKREALANSLKIAKQQILSLDSDLENTGAKKLEAEVKPLPNNKRGASYTWSSLLVLLIPAATIPLAVVRWDQNRRHRKTQQLATRDVTLL
eukprot:scaffold70961_cov26-Tisochrysis_lutea.AAC.1